MPLEPEDQKYLVAAQGYVELGMFLDADAKLDEIDPCVRHLPEVLAVRLEIYGELSRRSERNTNPMTGAYEYVSLQHEQ